jgi:Transposase DDE domain group 1
LQTQCNQESLEFHPLNQRQVVGRFDGGAISTDGGGLLLREVEKRTAIIEGFAACFRDHRAAEQIEHTVRELVAQRVYALALGYEDLNDHDELRRDPLLAVLAEKPDPSGESRVRERDRGKALAGKSTLNRLELTKAAVEEKERYKKIALDLEAVDRLLVKIFLEAHAVPPAEIVLDLDATDDPLHGRQEGRFFHGYYGHYCYLPLYIFSGDHLLCARLRPSNIDASAGCVEEVARIVAEIRQAWPEVGITLRGDSGFCREQLMSWCEQNQVNYVLGLAKNERLKAEIVEEQEQAAEQYRQRGEAARVFKEFSYQTRESWTRARRVIAKAEHLEKGANPRFVVTSLGAEAWEGRRLYEELYCARGEMENRIKEQLMLFADRTSTAFREVSAGVRKLGCGGCGGSEAVALRHPVMPVSDGLSG